MSAPATQLAEIEHTEAMPTKPAQVTEVGSAALALLQNALTNPDVPSERIDKMLEWLDRLEAKDTSKAYSKAFASMQAEIPSIPERGRGHNGITYALWDDVNKAIRPVLAKHGFALSFRTSEDAQSITMTAVLTHSDGHSEATSRTFPSDTSGSKNAIQAVGSTLTYGKRYLAGLLLNLTSSEEVEDDGQASSGTITDEQVSELAGLMVEAEADQEAFLKWAKVKGLKDLPSARFGQAQSMLRAKVAKAAKEGGEA